MGKMKQIHDMSSSTCQVPKSSQYHKSQTILSFLPAVIIQWEGVFVEMSSPSRRRLTSLLIMMGSLKSNSDLSAGWEIMQWLCWHDAEWFMSWGNKQKKKTQNTSIANRCECSALPEELHRHQCPENLADRQAICCLYCMAHVWNTSTLVTKLSSKVPPLVSKQLAAVRHIKTFKYLWHLPGRVY